MGVLQCSQNRSDDRGNFTHGDLFIGLGPLLNEGLQGDCLAVAYGSLLDEADPVSQGDNLSDLDDVLVLESLQDLSLLEDLVGGDEE